MFNNQDLKIILQESEGYRIEFKESLSGLDKELVAFANSSGGKIFLGIADDREIKGIRITNKLKSQIQDMANNCDPKVKIILQELKDILVIEVREGDDKPYKCSSGFYKRIGTNSQKLARNEIIDLFKSEDKVRFDELIEPKFRYPQDFDKERLNKFLRLAGVSKTSAITNILVNLGVAEKQEGKLYFSNVGILFFAKEPQRFVPWSVFTVALFKDKNGVDVIDRKETTGGLFEIVEQVMDFVKLYSKVAYRFTGKPQRENIYEYPFEAIREAVINSVMHKYYFEHGHNNILKFFPDKIRIENFWIEPMNFKLGKTIFRRNPLICDLFSRIHFGEKMGTGMQRMKDICRQENAPYPEIEYNENYFYITFKRSREYLKMVSKERVEEAEIILNDRQKKALAYLREKEKMTRRGYERLLGVTKITAIRDLTDLVNKKIIVKNGKGPSTIYFLHETI